MTHALVTPPTKVLLVEDSPGDARLIIELLVEVAGRGFEIERVDRLKAALERMRQVETDVLLLDLGLPDSVGLDTFSRAHHQVPHKPIVIISGLDDERMALDAVRSGAQDYLVKGQIDGPLLVRVLRYAIQRSRAELELAEREDRFRALVEHSADAMALLDRDGVVTYASSSTTRVLGRTPATLVGSNALELIHPDDVAAVRTRFQELLDRPGVLVEVEARYLHEDGSWRYCECSFANRLRDAAVRGVVLNYRDVTERRRLEDQLRQSQKLEAVGRLAGGVAHDFNNVLTAIFGYADFLTGVLLPGSPGRQDLDEIRNAATRAAKLTRQLLAFSRQQVLDPTVLNMNEVVQGIEPMLGHLIGEDVALRAALAPELGSVRADAGQIEQVIVNLAVNARDAMPTGGLLTIETSNVDLDEHYAGARLPVTAGRYVMLAVSDTGMGMGPEVRARIFEPFFTTKAKSQGTGLGLATVYGIVTQSGGYIWVYSEPGHGTTFKVFLPRVDAPPAAPERPAAPVETRGGTETILLAEDDELLGPLVRELLVKFGYTVLETRSAEEALSRASEYQGPIHLLLVDVVMPGDSGHELARKLAQTRPETRVLYTSGYTDEAVVRHGILERGINFLQKPFTPPALATRVREVLDNG
jgi:two-component system, cell cycle sensor histidine kinase and response regulator CckA